jgi:hypothetical protein
MAQHHPAAEQKRLEALEDVGLVTLEWHAVVVPHVPQLGIVDKQS